MDTKDEAGLGFASDWVQQALVSAYEDNCPLKPFKTGRQSLWSTTELETLRRGVRWLFNKCRSDKDVWALYREAQRNYRKEVRKASKTAWRTFCSSINDMPSSARLHRVLSSDPKIKLGSLVAPLGRCTQSEGETLELLLTTHFPNSVITQESAVPAAALLTGGWLQKGRTGNRFFRPIQKSRSGWHIHGLVTTGMGGCHSTPGQNISCLPVDGLCSCRMATG